MERTDAPTRPLGSTGLEITRLGVGAWAIGGVGWRFGWGPQDDNESIAAINRAVQRGFNWIDTAPSYGWGHSEEIVGRAIEGLRPRPYVFTKAGAVEGAGQAVVFRQDRHSIRREAEASLVRLGVDAIDLYQVHWPIPDEDIEEGWAALSELKDEGLVRHIGVSNFSVEQMRRISSIAPIETIQPEYSLIERTAEDDVLPYARTHGMGIVVYSPMASGLLAGKLTRSRIEALPADDWRTRHERFRDPQLALHLEMADRVRTVAERLTVAPGVVAIAWTLRNPAVDGGIVGLRRSDQVDELEDAASLELSGEDLAVLAGQSA